MQARPGVIIIIIAWPSPTLASIGRGLVPRLERQCGGNVLDGRSVISDQPVHGGALVPALGEVGCCIHQSVERRESSARIPGVHRTDPPRHQRVELFVAVIGAPRLGVLFVLVFIVLVVVVAVVVSVIVVPFVVLVLVVVVAAVVVSVIVVPFVMPRDLSKTA